MYAQLSRRVQFFSRILAYYSADRHLVLLLIATIGGATLLGLGQVWPLALLVDAVLADSGHPSWLLQCLPEALQHDVVGQIALLAAAMLLLRLFQEGLSLVRTHLHVRISHHGVLQVRRDLFRKLQALSIDFHRSQPQGDAIYRLMQDAPGCDQILSVLIDVVVASFTLVVMLVVMLTRSVPLSLVALAISPLLLLTNWKFGSHLKRNSTLAKSSESRLTSVAQRIFSNMVLVQAFQREHSEYDRFTQAAGDSAKAWLKVQRQMALYRLCVGTIFGTGGAIIFGFGGYLVWQEQMSVGDLMIFLTYLTMFYDPLCKISGAGANMQTGLAGMQRVLEVLDRQILVAEREGALELPRQARTLTLENVRFAYGGTKQILDGVNVRIEPGQMVAFVGSSGVGKSTLLNLLPRFYDPTGGTVRLDGLDLRDLKIRDVRRHVALVLQESPMLPATIGENIAYGRPDATVEQIRQVAEMSGADDFISLLPNTYDTDVAEAGANLSGGQRQRIAIARALLNEAPLVVLDEPTSAQDPLHEQQFVQTLRRLKGQRTFILVSHRLSTVQDCDQIFVMSHGQVVEQGTHEELLQCQGHYWEMAIAQQALHLLPQQREVVPAA